MLLCCQYEYIRNMWQKVVIALFILNLGHTTYISSNVVLCYGRYVAILCCLALPNAWARILLLCLLLLDKHQLPNYCPDVLSCSQCMTGVRRAAQISSGIRTYCNRRKKKRKGMKYLTNLYKGQLPVNKASKHFANDSTHYLYLKKVLCKTAIIWLGLGKVWL